MSHQTSMSIATFKKVAARMPPWTSILLRANHGVGKSKVVRQVAALLRKLLLERGIIKSKEEFPVIDRRLSQMTEGDMVGLPSTDGECTRFNPPDWYKRACCEPVVLFLDELNRATPEVMQAAFQIVLDRELNGWKLHAETRVFSAINAGAAYTVNEMDPALLDRFFAIDLHPEVKDFLNWARDTDPEQGGNLHPFVPDFIEQTAKPDGTTWLYPAKNAQPGSVQPSPRSWEAVNRALEFANIIDKPEDELFYQMCLGFVGVEASIAFSDYCKTVDNRITGEELVNKYHQPRVREKVKRMGQGRQNDVVDQVVTYVIKDLTKLTQTQGDNIKQILLDLPDELRVSLWCKITSPGINKLELAKSIHKHCAADVLGVFGVPMGEAGIGVIPNIPGIFRAPAKGGAPAARKG